MDMSIGMPVTASASASASSATVSMSGAGGMSGMGDSTDMMDMGMIPWLHFFGGDYLFFKSLRPSSHGAIAGACIILVILAIIERWAAATRCVLEARWALSARAIILARSYGSGDACGDCDASPAKESDSLAVGSIEQVPVRNERTTTFLRAHRSFPPFIPRHDITRGVLFMFQALLAYALMLAVMTFQAAYIISIIVGLGIGEVVFGRFGGMGGHVLH